MKSKISLPTFDFYRKNMKVFNKYKLDDWWWLATANGTTNYGGNDWVFCVSPFGNVDYNACRYYNVGVRPILHFVSSISVSRED